GGDVELVGEEFVREDRLLEVDGVPLRVALSAYRGGDLVWGVAFAEHDRTSAAGEVNPAPMVHQAHPRENYRSGHMMTTHRYYRKREPLRTFEAQFCSSSEESGKVRRRRRPGSGWCRTAPAAPGRRRAPSSRRHPP